MRFTGARGTASVRVRAPAVAAGRTVTFHVWLPAGNGLDAIQAYVQEGPSGRWRYTAAWRDAQRLPPGAWSAVEVRVPPDAVAPLYELGVEFRARGGWTGMAYVDSVRW